MKEMNEKELKKEIVEIFKKYKSVEDIGTRLIMLGFQKGKLEQKKEIKEFIKQEEADIKQLITDFKNEGYLMLDFIKDFIEVRRDRIKQLQEKQDE